MWRVYTRDFSYVTTFISHTRDDRSAFQQIQLSQKHWPHFLLSTSKYKCSYKNCHIKYNNCSRKTPFCNRPSETQRIGLFFLNNNDLNQGCRSAVFVKAMVCGESSFLQAQKTVVQAIFIKGFPKFESRSFGSPPSRWDQLTRHSFGSAVWRLWI